MKKIKLKRLWFDKEKIFIETEKGEIKSHPLRWFPRLNNATEKQRNNYRLSAMGIHWEELDEDLSFEGFFHYNKDEIAGQKNALMLFFEKFPEINTSEFARRIGISPTVMRHYACGTKSPSVARRKEIEREVHAFAEDLAQVILV